jgi:hypothetical protein
MVCLLALIVFSILGIFSATHRHLAKEAFDCVFRRITLRPCTTGFDQKIKGRVVGRLLDKSPKLAKAINRFWEPISWFLVILFFTSLFFSAQAIYNLVKYQSCTPQNPQSCVLTVEQQEKCQCQDNKITCPESQRDTCKEGECNDCEGCQQQRIDSKP